MKKLLAVIVITLVAGVGWYVWNNQNNITTSSSRSNKEAIFNKRQHSLDDPASIWVVVNKRQPLQPKTYAPDDLVTPNVPLRLTNGDAEMKMRKPAGDALEQLFAAAQKDGLKLKISSGYRSYSFQVNLYNHYVSVQGKAVADTQSARPGYSEHQTGLAVDVEPASRKCEVEECFGTTPEGQWIAANAYKYGFILRYPKDMQNITGYIYEPWHIRYVGTALSTEMHQRNTATLEQFFSLGNAPDYQ